MTKRLWNVTLEAEVVVLAETREEAEREAAALRDGDCEFSAFATPFKFLPADWDTTCIPFGDQDDENPDKNIRQWIEAGAAPEYRK